MPTTESPQWMVYLVCFITSPVRSSLRPAPHLCFKDILM